MASAYFPHWLSHCPNALDLFSFFVPLNSGKDKVFMQFSLMSFVFLPLAKSFQFLFHFGKSVCEVYVCMCLSICLRV